MSPLGWATGVLALVDVAAIVQLVRSRRLLNRCDRELDLSAASMRTLIDDNTRLQARLTSALTQLATGPAVPANPDLIQAVPAGYQHTYPLPVLDVAGTMELRLTRPAEGPPLLQLELWILQTGALGPVDMKRVTALQLVPEPTPAPVTECPDCGRTGGRDARVKVHGRALYRCPAGHVWQDVEEIPSLKGYTPL